MREERPDTTYVKDSVATLVNRTHPKPVSVRPARIHTSPEGPRSVSNSRYRESAIIRLRV